ncbi:MAG: hypothetical protein WA584_07750 [Pyrinomonadaceae bacterium]
MTLPTTKTGKAKVYPGRGVIINYIHYWTPHFRNPKVENKNVPVRFDPFNTGVAYAYVNKGWQRCLSAYYDVFNNRSEKEILIAPAEIKQMRKGLGRFQLNAKILAQFLLSVDAAENELILIQRQRDLEMKQILAHLDPCYSFPINHTESNAIKLLSGEVDNDNPEDFELRDAEDIDDEPPIDLSKLKTFGDY